MPERVTTFGIDGIERPVRYIETTRPNEHTECDVYAFNDSVDYDLAIVEVKSNRKTPLQRVIKGDKTIEGYLFGEGIFYLNNTEHVFPSRESKINVQVGDIMQWKAGERGLVFFEMCYPPYVDGRFEDVES